MKGVSVEIATSILFLVIVAGASTTFLLANDIISASTDRTVSEIDNIIEEQDIETRTYADPVYNNYTAIIRNIGDYSANLSVFQGGEKIEQTLVGSNETELVNLGCAELGNTSIRLQGYEYSEEEQISVYDGYCIEIVNTTVREETLPSGEDQYFKYWEARAYRNNYEEEPYDNRNVTVNIDGATQTIETNSSGEFSFKEEWDLARLEPNEFFRHQEVYSSASDIVNTRGGRGRFQPPNQVGYSFNDPSMSDRFETTEMGFEVKRWSDNAKVHFEVLPVDMTDTQIELKVATEVEIKSELEDDWNSVDGNPSIDGDLIYHMPLQDGDNPHDWKDHAEISSLTCSTSSGVSCITGNSDIEIVSPVNGKSFDTSDLPVNGAGNRYIPRNVTIEANGHPFVGGLDRWEWAWYYQGSSWERVGHEKDMVYVPDGDSVTVRHNIELQEMAQKLRNQFENSSRDGTTQYRRRVSAVPSAPGWGGSPRMIRTDNTYYSIGEPLDNSPTSFPKQNSHKAATFEWDGDVSAGESYELNYTMTVQRDSTEDKKIFFPLSQGTFGIFPDTGGKPVSTGPGWNTYIDDMIRYPEYGNAGVHSFSMEVPEQGSSDVVTYKNVYRRSGDEWVANTYILNTAQTAIDQIFLLNSRGEWIEMKNDHGAYFPDPGNTYSDSFSLEDNQGEITQINLEFASNNWSVSEPSYSDWDYSFPVNIKSEDGSNYPRDLSARVDCNTGSCGSVLSGWSQATRSFEDLRLLQNSPAPARFGENENIDKLEFEISNPSSGAGQNLDDFKWWIWYLQPTTAEIEPVIRPDKITIKTTESEASMREGFWMKTEFD